MLIACPFCGSPDAGAQKDQHGNWSVICGGCGARGPYTEHERSAVALWAVRAGGSTGEAPAPACKPIPIVDAIASETLAAEARTARGRPRKTNPPEAAEEALARLPAEGFVRLEQILAIFPISARTWRRGVEAGRYPKPVFLSPQVAAWHVDTIRALIDPIQPGNKPFGPREPNAATLRAEKIIAGQKA